eukprot:3839090-Amphidinium_carterae.1
MVRASRGAHFQGRRRYTHTSFMPSSLFVVTDGVDLRCSAMIASLERIHGDLSSRMDDMKHTMHGFLESELSTPKKGRCDSKCRRT